jgi:polysaccharide export outer membrane protein
MTLLVCLVAGAPRLAAAQQSAQQGEVSSASVRRAVAAHPRPGDRVWLHVWREPKMSDTVMVDERGEVLFPKIGIVNASAMTIADFRDTVRGRFAEFLRDAPVDVAVLRRIVVNGSVGRPNVYYIDVTTTVRDAIARAGGVTDEGNPHKVVIVRDGRQIPVPDWELDNSTNSELRSGDQIVVSRKPWFASNLLPAVSVFTGVAFLLITLVRH